MTAKMTVLLMSVVVGGLGAAALGLPDDHVVTVDIYDDPTDPESDVAFTIKLHVSADRGTLCESGTCGSVAWEITSVELRRPQAGGDRVWFEEFPYVDTVDGLWWVNHADVEVPADDEFVTLPPVSGTATAEDPQGVNLDYEFEGHAYENPPPVPPFGDNTGALIYRMAEEGQSEPVEESEEEPEPVVSSGAVDPD